MPLFVYFLPQSNEVYDLVSRDLTEVSAQASSTIGSAANNVKKTLVVSSIELKKKLLHLFLGIDMFWGFVCVWWWWWLDLGTNFPSFSLALPPPPPGVFFFLLTLLLGTPV